MKSLLVFIVLLIAGSATVYAQTKAGKKEKTPQTVSYFYTGGMHPEIMSHQPGACPKCNTQLVIDRRGTKQASTDYTCSMHPDVKRDKPGKCPICGMDLVGKKEHTKSKLKA